MKAAELLTRLQRWWHRDEDVVLCLLSDAALGGPGEMYGLGLVRASAGKLSRGVVYITLGNLERSGLVTSREETSTSEDIGIPRRLYRLTELGSVEAMLRREAGRG